MEKKEQKLRRLTPEEYKRWWPFDWLDPRRFPEPVDKKPEPPYHLGESPL
jgi:hypothetical protein